MKVVQAKPQLLLLGLLVGIILGVVFLWGWPEGVVGFSAIYWVILAVSVFIAVFPKSGQCRLGERSASSPSAWKVFGEIVALEVVLMALYEIFERMSTLIPIGWSEVSMHPYFASWDFLWLHVGLFPWAAIAMLTVGWSLLAYRQQQEVYPSDLISPPFSLQRLHNFAIMTNVSMRLLPLMAIGFAGMLCLVLLAYVWMGDDFLGSFTGMSPVTLIFLIAFILISMGRTFRLRVHHTVVEAKLPAALVMGSLTLLLALIVVGVSYILGIQEPFRVYFPAYMQPLLSQGWWVIWRIFSLSWWLIWIIPTSLYFARLVKGYSVRRVIGMILALPFLLAVIAYMESCGIMPKYPGVYSILPTGLVCILAWVGFLWLLLRIFGEHHLSFLMQGYFDDHPHGKYRPRDHYVITYFQVLVFGIFLYLTSGIVSLTILSFIFTIPAVIFILVATGAIAYRLIRMNQIK